MNVSPGGVAPIEHIRAIGPAAIDSAAGRSPKSHRICPVRGWTTIPRRARGEGQEAPAPAGPGEERIAGWLRGGRAPSRPLSQAETAPSGVSHDRFGRESGTTGGHRA